MFRWLLNELVALIVGIILVIGLIVAFFAFDGPAFISSVIDGVVRETGGVIG